MMDIPVNNPTLRLIFYFIILTIFTNAIHSLFRGSQEILKLYHFPKVALTEHEQQRLDKLLESGKRYHNLSFIFSGILIALSSLDNFDSFVAPFGEIAFPKLQTAIGLYFLCIISLIVTDKYFLMAYPWIKIDHRRPPFD